MAPEDEEAQRLRSVALQNAQSILVARQRADRELLEAKDALERKSNELERSLAMMRATLESTADGILVVDTDDKVQAYNAQFALLWRIPDEVMASRERHRILETALRQIREPEAFLARTEAIYASDPPESFDLIDLADGRVFERWSRVQRVEERTVGRVWSFRDITPRKRAEEELRHQREWLEVTLSSIGDAVIATDMEARVTFLNPVAADLTGWSSREAAGRPLDEIFQVVNERTRRPAFSPVKEVLAKGISVALENDTALIARDGREVAIEDSAAPIRDPNGRIAGAVMVFHDVTLRRRTQAALRASHDQFSAILDQSPVGVYLVDAELRVRHVNPKARPVFERLGDVLGRDFAEVLRLLWPGEVANELVERFRRTLRTGESFFQQGFSAVREDHPKQEFYDWEIHRIELPDGQQGVVCYFTDISAHVLAQQALARSEEELRALADSIPNLAWMANPDGHIFWYNRRWYEYTGTTFEEMQGWGWQKVHRADTLPSVKERWSVSISTGAVFEMEFPLRGADGAFRWFLTRVNPVRDEFGNVIRWFGTNTDVDQVRRANEAMQEETRILDLLNSTGQGIASILDLETLLQTVTDAGTQLSGAKYGAFFYNVSDAKGESFQLYTLSGAPRAAFEKLGLPRSTPIFSPTFHGEGVVRSDDITQDPRFGAMAPDHGMPGGHLAVRSYLATSVTSRSGDVIGGLFFGHPDAGIFTERSERLIVGIAAQAAVAIDNARLFEAAQREIVERTRTEELLAAARDSAETANLAKDHFLAALSHELRTPLTPVLAILSSLREEGGLSAELGSNLEVVRRNVELEARLIDDLLDLTRITRGKLHLHCEEVTSERLIQDAINTCRAELDAKQLSLTTEEAQPSPVVEVDSARATQIIWNLLKNAIKFTPIGGSIVIRSRLATGSGHDQLIIEVEDSGIGLEPEKIERVFQAFEQGDRNTGRQFGGLGLGLAISRAIAESHGGTLHVTSAGPGQGSTFTLTLPCKGCDDRESPQAFRRSQTPPSVESKGGKLRTDYRPLRILLVEDHADTAAILLQLLRRMGHYVVHAGSIAHALELAATEMQGSGLDLLLSDLGLPDGSGTELMRELSAKYQISGIALSGYGMDADLEQSAAAGFARHLVKPIDLGLLRRTISDLMGTSSERA